MNKNNSILSLAKYKNAYVKAVNEINAIRNNNDLTNEAKQRRIDEITRKTDFEPYRAAAISDLKALQNSIRDKRKNDIVNGLKSANEVILITDAIKNGAFNGEMMKDIIDIYGDNPVALNAIRGALNSSDNESVRMLSAEIPKDGTEKAISGIEKAIKNIENVPPVLASSSDLMTAMWQSGSSFDNIANFVEVLAE